MKKVKIQTIVIIILVIALLGTSSYIIYDNVLREDKKEVKEVKKEKDEKEEKEIKTEEISTSEEEILKEQIMDYTRYLADTYPTKVEEMDNQKVLYFALMKLNKTGEDFMESELEKVLEQFFGTNHPFVHEDIICTIDNEPLYRYDSAKRQYFFQDIHAHGGSGVFMPNIYEIQGEKVDNKYTVKAKILYNDYCGEICSPKMNYYKSVEDSLTGENPVFGPYDMEYEITEEEYNQVKDQIPTTIFTFIKDENNNYGLESVTI